MAKNDRPGKLAPANLESVKRELLGVEEPEPAKGGRFKPGQSGNPRGRPKRVAATMPSMGEQSLHAATVRAAMTPVPVRENGTSTLIPMFEAIIRAQMTGGAKGNPLAQRDALLRIERAHREVARELEEEHAFWSRYRDQKWAEIERAKQSGAPLPNPLPHPDDIVIAAGREVRVHGPIDEAQAVQCAELCRLRDTLLLQHALDEKLEPAHPGDGYRAGGALLCALLMNHALFKRFQLGEGQLIWRLLCNQAISKRQLLKTLHRGWRSFGLAAPRGMPFASVEIVTAALQLQADLITAIRAGDIDPDALGRGEYDETALGLIAKHKIKAA